MNHAVLEPGSPTLVSIEGCLLCECAMHDEEWVQLPDVPTANPQAVFLYRLCRGCIAQCRANPDAMPTISAKIERVTAELLRKTNLAAPFSPGRA